MLSEADIKKAKTTAEEELLREEMKLRISLEKAKIMARKLHWFPKRLVFQWPFRLEDWHKHIGG